MHVVTVVGAGWRNTVPNAHALLPAGLMHGQLLALYV